MFWATRILRFLDRQKKITLWGFLVLFLLGLGLIDYLTGAQFSISLFSLLPISLASWSLGKRPGQLTALFAAIIMLMSNLLARDAASDQFVVLWNTTIRLAVFLIFATLLAEFRSLLKHQTELSRTDPLTSVLNRRAFYEAANTELKRIDRHQRPLTVVFLDLDNFKAVNDASGHLMGDRLLLRVAERIKLQLRATDTVARLGGDEYGVLLPETDEPTARTVIPRLQTALLEEMAQAEWPVTFSMGILTCNTAPPGIDEAIHLADQLMYKAKRTGKNCSEYGCYPDS